MKYENVNCIVVSWKFRRPLGRVLLIARKPIGKPISSSRAALLIPAICAATSSSILGVLDRTNYRRTLQLPRRPPLGRPRKLKSRRLRLRLRLSWFLMNRAGAHPCTALSMLAFLGFAPPKCDERDKCCEENASKNASAGSDSGFCAGR
jgi:hypothetical protein